MKRSLIKTAVKTRFRVWSRAGASKQIERDVEQYLGIARRLGEARSAMPARVPPMLGVDEDMRDWSIYMILEHNTIVNRNITKIVRALSAGEQPADRIDPKKDVMPSAEPGPEQVASFQASVHEHLQTVKEGPRLRFTVKSRHPIFGPMDAHGWHCMVAFHLRLHLKQAEAVASALSH